MPNPILNRYSPPPPINLQRVGASSWESFLAAGHRISEVIATQIKIRSKKPAGVGENILDFGCGCGRVLYPMLDTLQNCSFTAVDVDSSAISYLKTQLSSVNLAVTSFQPPLPFEDAAFDAVYSVSIWTHLSPDDQQCWLSEIARVVRPGGIALITTSSYSALAARKRRGDHGWSSVTEADLKQQGVMFIPYAPEGRDLWTPGVDRPYGLTLNDPIQVANDFANFFSVETVIVDAIDGVQDLVVLRR